MASDAPLVTFKAGICEYDSESSSTVKPIPTPGYISISQDDGLSHFTWRPRSSPHTEPEVELLIVPEDATFRPYRPENAKTAIAGRIYILKFSSSGAKHFFWLQSGSKNEANRSEFSTRDLKIGEIVNKILAGEEVDVREELNGVRNEEEEEEDDDDDTAMEDVDGPGASGGNSGLRRAASGGAGAGATGGDIRNEGEGAREGGADGGRAASSSTATTANATQAAVASFLQSLSGTNLATSDEGPSTTFPDLLPTSITVPLLSTLSSSTLSKLISHLPPSIPLLSSGLSPSEIPSLESDTETLSAILLSLDDNQKREILAKILRSPQFTQGLAGFTNAVRSGGLEMIAKQLDVPVENGGLVKGGRVPLGGGKAVKGLVDGYKRKAEQETDAEDEDEEMS